MRNEEMTALIGRLRCEAEWAEANEWDVPLMLSDDLKRAADIIERLLKESTNGETE